MGEDTPLLCSRDIYRLGGCGSHLGGVNRAGRYGMSCSGVCTISVKVRALHERLTRQSAGTEMTITLFLLIVNISIEKVGLKRNHSGVVGAVVAALW